MSAFTLGSRLGRLRLPDRSHAKVHAPPLPRPPAYVVVLATVGVLNIIGLVMILSASSVAALSNYGSSWYFFNRQLAWALLGAAAFAIAARVDYRLWKKWSLPLFVIAVGLLVVVLIPGIGISVEGGRRWLGYGALRFQPSEVAKLALVVCGAQLIASRPDLGAPRAVRPVFIVFGTVAALVLLEPDLDSTVVLGLVAFALLAIGGLSFKRLAQLGLLGVGGAALLSVAEPYRRARVFAFLHPWADSSNTGYQIAQSLIALGSGGVNGVGLGAGRAKWLFLPNAHTDFIFAIIGEELGLVGCLLVLALFAGFGIVGFHIARDAPDRFGMLLAAGITTWVVGQAAINMGAVVGLLPVSGITLPFLSAGGSSLVFVMAAAGILANIARQAARPAPRTAARRAR